MQKLVRDGIPDIITADGMTPRTRIIKGDEYLLALDDKLGEEVDEYFNGIDGERALDELADVLEVIHAIAAAHGSSFRDIDNIRQTKYEERGGFEGGVFLEGVE